MRKLNANEIECRVAQVGQNGCSLLLYKTARVDRAILDETFGQFGWQNDFKVIDGKMYGGIGIYSKDTDSWLWRWDCGTESNTEAEKGQASDCFKRAGFKWGIGVELYSAPFIFAKVQTVKNPTKNKYELVDKYIKFIVKEIGYSDNGEINRIIITDDKGTQVYKMGSTFTPQPKPLSEKDIDIIEGLKGMDTKEHAYDYYKEYKDSVDDLERFKNEYQRIYKSLPKVADVQRTD